MNEKPADKPLSSWVSGLAVGGVIVAILAVGAGLLFVRQLGDNVRGPRPIVTETKVKNAATGLTLTKRVERFKNSPDQLITLAIGGYRSVPEPFAFYQRESRSEFHWDHDKLDACIEGEGYTDKGGYWSDHVDLPDGGRVEIVQTCGGPKMIPSSAATAP